MKHTFLLIFYTLLQGIQVLAQEKVTPSEGFKIEGKIKKEWNFTIAELMTMEAKVVSDITISNQKGEVKGKATGLKGIPLKSILEKLEFQVEKPKDLNEFYLVLEATDGYRVVFSWNEVFNTEVGNNLYVITEKDGKKLNEMPERILIVSSSDLKIGRRYIKGVNKISVNRLEGKKIKD
jgi:hypothetical protein